MAWPIREMASMLWLKVSLLTFVFVQSNVSQHFRMAKVAFCKACWALPTRRSVLRLKWFIWLQISGLTLATVISAQFSGLVCLVSNALSLSVDREIPQRFKAMLARFSWIFSPTGSSSFRSASRLFK